LSVKSLPLDRQEWSHPYWFRAVEVVFGLATVVMSLVVIADPGYGAQNLVPLLSFALIFSAVRMITAGGVRKRLKSLGGLGLTGSGVVALVLVTSNA